MSAPQNEMCTNLKVTCSGKPLLCSLQQHNLFADPVAALGAVNYTALEAVVSWE